MAETNITTFSQMVNREMFQAKVLASEATVLLEDYFRAIKGRYDSGEAYPYEIDEMVPTVFTSKHKAVEALLRDFAQDVDFTVKTVRLMTKRYSAVCEMSPNDAYAKLLEGEDE